MKKVAHLWLNIQTIRGDKPLSFLLERGFWQQIWMRGFKHRNLFEHPDVIRKARKKRENMKHKQKYGTSGSLTAKYGRRLMKRDGPMCQGGCGTNLGHKRHLISVDHKIPVAKGGTNDESNLQLMCKRCNGEKADRVHIYKPEPMQNLLIKDAMEAAGITPENMPHLFGAPSPLSKSDVEKTPSPEASRQYQS